MTDHYLFHALPDALADALAEQLPTRSVIDRSAVADTIYDIVITCPTQTATARAAAGAATPLLSLTLERRQRLGTVLRQMGQMLEEPSLYLDDIPFGEGLFQPQDKAITTPSGTIALTDKEVEILAYLLRMRGQAVRRDDMLRHVWRYQSGVDTHTLETHIYRLRQKLAVQETLKDMLVTDDDGGYRLKISD